MLPTGVYIVAYLHLYYQWIFAVSVLSIYIIKLNALPGWARDSSIDK